MRKLATVLALLLLIAVGAWSAFWVYGKNRIVNEIELQAQSIREQGGEATYARIDVGGFPFGYNGRVVEPTVKVSQTVTLDVPAEDGTASEPLDLTTEYVWTAPWMDASAGVTSPGTVTFTFPETQRLAVSMPAIAEETPETIVFDIGSQDMAVDVTRGNGGFDFDGGAAALTMASDIPVEADEGDARLDFTMRDMAAKGRWEERGTREMAPFRVDYTVAGMTGTVDAKNAENGNGKVVMDFGASESVIDTLGSANVATSVLKDIKFTVTAEAMGNQPLDFTVARMTVDTSLPNAGAPEPQAFAYAFSVEDVVLPDLAWMLLDPQQAFPRSIERLALDIDGSAVFTVPPTDTQAMLAEMQESGGLPLDVRDARIKELDILALGLKAKGQGEVDLSDALPKGSGTLGIEGFPAFMEALVKSGRVPPQQAMVAQLMVENFGKVEGDTIRFDLRAAPDGMVYVNDIPIGEAPPLPQ